VRVFAAELRPAVLVLAGHWDERYPQVRQIVAAKGWQQPVRLLGSVPAALVPALYSGALGFVFPSLYEGFGLPVLEAMAAGVPVACARASSLPEVAGNAALLFDPADDGALAAALAQLLADASLRADLRARGLVQARAFSWERAADATAGVYAEAGRRVST
jgi:alpha-1,3-rhamnosyl/mannosyltransferase